MLYCMGLDSLSNKHRVLSVRLLATFISITSLILISGVSSTKAFAGTYYIAPNGSDADIGTSEQPWKTWSHSLAKLKPGDSLIVKSGTYTPSTGSGYPNIDCNNGYSNGTSTFPITVKAETERQAFLNNDGSIDTTFSMNNCSYWIIEGLHMKSGDFDNGTTWGGHVLGIADSSHLTFRRLLVTNNNRYRNSHLVSVARSVDSLFEEIELYWFHRHAIRFHQSNRNIIRRSYANSRQYRDIPSGNSSVDFDKGDACFLNYPGSDNIMENNICEDSNTGFQSIAASSESLGNLFLGNITLNVNIGWLQNPQEPFTNAYPTNNTAKNHVSVNSSNSGVWTRNGVNNRCINCSVIDGNSGLQADVTSAAPLGTHSFYSDNSLAYNNEGTGFYVTSQADWLHRHSNSYNNPANYSPSNSSNYVEKKEINPQLGSCKVFIPDGSPLKAAGLNGADIGANVLYRYEDGVLTGKTLWNPGTGEFPCGEVVTGVNDVAASSCFDVHKRLNVNTNGCSFPANYGTGQTLPLAPSGLTVQQ